MVKMDLISCECGVVLDLNKNSIYLKSLYSILKKTETHRYNLYIYKCPCCKLEFYLSNDSDKWAFTDEELKGYKEIEVV